MVCYNKDILLLLQGYPFVITRLLIRMPFPHTNNISVSLQCGGPKSLCNIVNYTTVSFRLDTFTVHLQWSVNGQLNLNSPVSRKLKYLRNINEPQLTMVAQHPVATWRL